jgi:hypothetical protein
MPSSHFLQINEIVEVIVTTNPEKVLDIGIGFGKYGFLAREYLELWDDEQPYAQWKRRIDGIEAFEKYITPIQKSVYDTIYTGNALEVVEKLDTEYDLVLLIDVLEHFDHEDGLKLLQELVNRHRNILISTPFDIGVQEDIFDNPYEIHRFQWRKKHFSGFNNKFFISSPFSLLCFIGEDSKKVKSAIKSKGWNKIKYNISLIFPFLKVPYRYFRRIRTS